MSSAFVFPGQGSQKIGMGAAFINGFRSAMNVIEEIEDAISFKISRIIESGPDEELTKTENAQVAIFAVSMACVAVLDKDYGYRLNERAMFLAGHSLGEYTALCAAGVFSICDGAKLVRSRGEIMSRISFDKTKYTMMALLGASCDDLEPIVAPYSSGREICVIANDNSNTQVVLSGHRGSMLKIIEEAKKVGLEKVIELNTSGPFHSPLMAETAIEFDRISKDISFAEPVIPVVANISARPLQSKDDIHETLVRHITSRVRWKESVDFMIKNGVKNIVEIGHGKTLSMMIKRSNPDINSINIGTVAQMEEFVQSDL